MSTAYEQKFGEFLRMIAESKAQGIDGIRIHNPQDLGDDYAELVESLNRLADAELALMVTPRDQRGDGAPPTEPAEQAG